MDMPSHGSSNHPSRRSRATVGTRLKGHERLWLVRHPETNHVVPRATLSHLVTTLTSPSAPSNGGTPAVGDIVHIAQLRSACTTLLAWSANPPTAEVADWVALERAVRALQSARHVGGPLGDAIEDVVGEIPDPDGSRLATALETMRRVLRIDAPLEVAGVTTAIASGDHASSSYSGGSYPGGSYTGSSHPGGAYPGSSNTGGAQAGGPPHIDLTDHA